MIANKGLGYEDKTDSVLKRVLDKALWLHWLPVLMLIGVVMVGLGFRLFGLGYGLPYFYGPPDVRTVLSGFEIVSPYASDELQFMNATMRLLAQQTLNPDYFAQPGTPLMYLGALLFGIIVGIGLLVGIFPSIEAVSNLYSTDPTVFYITYRLLVACIDVGSIILIYALGRRLFNHRVGLLAALIYALSPVNIYIAKVIRADTLMVFFILAAFWFCLDMLESRTWRAYILAGCMTGLAIVSKYPAAVFIPMLPAAHAVLWRRGEADHRKLLVALLAIGVGAFIGSPFVFLDFPNVLAAVVKESESHLSGASAGLVNDVIWYLGTILPVAVSTTASLLAAVGVVLCIRAVQWRYRLLLLFPLIFLVFISSLGIRWERWLVPVIPFAALLAGYAAVSLTDSLRRRDVRLASGGVLVLSALIFIPLVQTNLLYGSLLNRPETRTVARQWIVENLPADSHILIERHGPQPPKSLFHYYEEHQGQIRPVEVAERPFNNLYAYGELGNLTDLDQVAATGIDYLILSDFYDRYLAEAALFPDEVARYEQIRALGEIIYEVGPVAGQMSGPRVVVIALPQS